MRDARGFCLTDRDLEVLRFAAAHRFVLACHVKAWLGAHQVVAYRRLRGLVSAGLLEYRRIFHARPGCFRVKTAGLAAIESPLPRPTIDLRSYRHDLGLIWLWLAANRGDFGSHRAVLAEREMRSLDHRERPGHARFAIPVGGYAPSGRPRVHFPDLVLTRADGSRLALELELTLKSRSRLQAIIVGYAAERRIAGVVYLTDSEVIAAALSEMTRMFGLDGRIDIRYLERASARELERRTWRGLSAGDGSG